MHPEDGYLDSCNIIHWALKEKRYSKIWIVVDPCDNVKLEEFVHRVISNQRGLDSRDRDEWRDGCPVSIQHKRLLLTPGLLTTTSVRFQTLGQKAGDLVYVGPNVFHQVINLNVNLAEAVNIGSSLWNVAADRFRPCHCKAEEDRAVNSIPQNSVVYETIQSHCRPFYDCQIQDCPSTFATTKQRQAHIARHKMAEKKNQTLQYLTVRRGIAARPARLISQIRMG